MGGHAFDLKTPPIPHDIYLRLVAKFTAILQTLHETVRVAPHSPEKVTHGDIDILVASPFRSYTNEELFALLGAKACLPGFPTANFAIPEPELDAYVQLDIRTCPPEKIEWETFHRAYGDLWNILGAMGKRVGISVNNSGVRVAVEHIEKQNKKAAMVHLTDDPRAAIEFFGCDWEQYERGFGTVEEMFDFCAKCRFLDIGVYQRRKNITVESRRLRDARPLCRRWLDVYLPKLMVAEKGEEKKKKKEEEEEEEEREIKLNVHSRESVLEEALEKFDKRLDHDMLVGMWGKDLFDKEMWRRIRALLPLGMKRRSLVVRTLAKRLQEEDQGNGEYGEMCEEEEWRREREAKWTEIAKTEWRAILLAVQRDDTAKAEVIVWKII
ncbi:hypothetical protein L873DRAFT_1837516 [Choiromyces venosus 120613-1]|uniref:Uncharacterized protein n=1 Tax=Choiromyces venosus 120613-1 TaxID=1336337 RepID=A0A3N4JCH8_9PEZI|nr:hypothetical protein L873DRAFT_1837516 [Choiromyces venosus 120613-1]